MRDDNNLYWIWLSLRFGAASKDFPRIVDSLTDPYEIYRLSEDEIEQLRVSDTTKQRLCDKTLTEAYSILKYCTKEKVDIISFKDKRYPDRLRAIEDPPVLLYCKGRFPDMNARLCVGMVGTRKMSEYGRQTAYKISYELSAAGVCVVSGMALGIDGACAVGAIEGGGCTVAVLGCGISVTYPRVHTKLSRAIERAGAVITEYPPFEGPNSWNFPKRNRIISGLCQGVLVVEGAKGSGALITSTRAHQQGREIFAVPGKVDDVSSDGPNELIRNGATIVLDAKDVIRHYEFLYKDTLNIKKYERARAHSSPSERIFERYGMSYAAEERTSVDVKTKSAFRPDAEDVKKEKRKEIETHEEKSAQPIPGALDALDENTRRIYGLLPDGAFTPDALAAKGIAVYHAVTALTMLEICGLVTSLPGGMYKKT